MVFGIFKGKSKGLCKAYENGRCIVSGRDTGPCSWDPNNWESCNVFKTHLEFYGNGKLVI